MKGQLGVIIDNAISFLLLAIVGVTPLLFLNQTTEFFEMPKLIFLVVSTVVLLGLWIFSWIVKGKVQITRTPLDIPMLILLGIVIASTYFSASRFQSIYGNFPRVHGSAVAWVTYIIFYFVAVSNLKNFTKLKTLMYVLYGSAAVVALITVLSFFNIYLPFSFAKAVNFTPTGSSFSTIALLSLLLPLPLLSIVSNNKYMPAPIALTLSILFGATVALVGSLPSYVALAIIFALCFMVTKPHKVAKFRKSLPMFLTPVAVVGLVIVLINLPFPGNKLQELGSKFPHEIQLPFAVSWKISASTFRDAPFIGTGPSTYLFNFTNYKPLEFNLLDYWNFTFDTAYNEFLQVLGTLGILGLLSLALVCLIVFVNAWRNLSMKAAEVQHDNTTVIVPALAVSAITAIVLLAIHTTTLVSFVATIVVFVSLMVAQKSIREKVMHFSMGLKASTVDDRQFDLLPIIFFVVFLIVAVPVLYTTYNAVLADYYHRQALTVAAKSGTQTYTNLQKAESLNPVIDLYRVDIAQTNFALANALAIQKGPTKDNPKGTLTDQDRRTIQTLLSQAINEGRIAVALSPLSSRNWVVLASIYRNISGVAQNALAFSLDAYGRAIQRDPLNPELRLNVGGVYYAAKNYDLAIRFFTDAANLKPNHANAYFNLAIALRDKGDVQNAKLVADQVVNILAKNNPNSNDYKVAQTLQKELTEKAAEASKNTQTAPAAQTNTGLQGENLQNVGVNGLNNPPTPATPAAVKKNPSTNLPTLNATPTAAPKQ